MENEYKPIVSIIADTYRTSRMFSEKYLEDKSIKIQKTSDMRSFELEDFIVEIKPKSTYLKEQARFIK